MIRTLLVANRGEIASRIFRTCRAAGIRTVAVYAEPDATLPFVREADVAIALGGSSSSESYLDIDKLIAAAHASGADAIHPGFGFLSENAAFAQAVLNAGLTWVGPTPANIVAMGTKVEAKQLAAAAHVPILPSGVAVGDDAAAWLEMAATVGYPVLVKASSGGGGRGMRIVLRADDLSEAVIGARREAAASFGDATVFIERYLPAPRHIEFQIFGDTHGNLIHLGERECSIQRRHQKIVEEAPSPILNTTMRAAMANAAVGLAKAISYVGAGTVEFLYNDAGTASPEFFFLEMNTRLQVEHPVTECVTGFDLVRWQLDVANGLPLPVSQDQVTTTGHAIEVRLYAENPAQDFAPTFGHLHTYQISKNDSSRYEHGVESGSAVTTFFDPMIAKVISHAPTRYEAASKLKTSLQGMAIHGVTVNRDYLVDILGTADFLLGKTTTRFVEDHPAAQRTSLSEADERAHTVALTLVHSLRRRRHDRHWSFARAGWRNMGNPYQSASFDSAQCGTPHIAYRWHADDHASVIINGGDWDTRVLRATQIDTYTDELTISLDGRTSTVRVTVIGNDSWCNSSTGQTHWTSVARFPDTAVASATGGPIAPVPGRVVAIMVAVGDNVEAGQTLVVMEAMKMEHRIEARTAGIVAEIRCQVGAQVDAHQLLVTFE
jgi:propionyl-CoA carboxylase alpha chain